MSDRDRGFEELRGISRQDVLEAGIHSVDELPMFRQSIETNFEGKDKETLLTVAESVEKGEGVPESAVDPGIREREPTPGDPESIRRRLTGEAGTPSDEYDYKTKDDALFTELVGSNDLETLNEDDAFVQIAGEDTGAPLTQEQVDISGERVDKAEKYNQTERTARARTVDENYNAPVTTNYERWKKNPSRLDFAGVDTIPKDERQRRASQFAANAQQEGFVENFEIGTGLYGERRPGTRGNASGSTVEVDTSRAYNAEETLAHEVGHKVEERVREREGGLFQSDEASTDATTLSTQIRGEPDDPYRESDSERFADAVAATVLSPRRAKRDAPQFVEELINTLTESERSAFPSF